MRLATLVALGVALGYAVLKKGGVEQQDWNLAVLVIGVAGFAHFIFRLRDKIPRLDRTAGILAGVFLFFVALQIVPLPSSFVTLASPKRVELWSAAAPIFGTVPKFLTLSTVPQATAACLLTVSAYFLVFLVIRELTLRLSPWMTALPLLVIGGLEAALGIFQANAESATGMATGTYVNRNHYAGLLEMTLPLAAVYAVAVLQRDRSRLESPAAPALKASILLALSALMLVGIVLSLSRTGFLSTLAAFLVAGFLASPLGRLGEARRVPWWRKWAPITLVVILVVVVFVFLPTNAFIARFADLAKTEEISADTRAQLWRNTTGLVKDYPLFGCGMGAYESCFLRYKTVAPMSAAEYAHNDYLQVLAELGVFGFLAGLGFVFLAFQRTVRGALHARSSDERYVAIACVASMSAMLLHSLVDFNMYIPANGMVFAWILGIVGIHLQKTT